MAKRSRFSPEVRERAVRMVYEHGEEHASQWAAITSIASKIGCSAYSGQSGQLLRFNSATYSEVIRPVRPAQVGHVLAVSE